MTDAPKIVVVKNSFFAHVDGRELLIQAGSALYSTHPLVEADPSNFRKLVIHDYQADLKSKAPEKEDTPSPAPAAVVEEATSTPGEVRKVPTPPKSTPRGR